MDSERGAIDTGRKTMDGERMDRDVLDLLRGRVELLAGKDKVLMTMYLENGTSFRQLAQLVGVSEVTIARRIRRLIARLTDGCYIACLRKRDRFSRTELAVARDHFLNGLSMREIAASRCCSVYSVYKTLGRIKRVLAADNGQGAGLGRQYLARRFTVG